MTGYLRSLIDLNGTASRKRAWIIFGIFLTCSVLAPLPPQPFVLLGLGVITVIWQTALVQRLHDAGRSGYWSLTTLIPLVPALVILLLKPKLLRARPHPIAQGAGYVVFALFMSLCVSRAFLWQPFFIQSESQKPTLLVGDLLIATRVDVPQRGDVLVYRHPVNGQDYISRLIGLPGDTVQMRAGLVYLNGAVLPQIPDGTFEEIYAPQGSAGKLPRCTDASVEIGGKCIRQRLAEIMPDGRKHDVLNTEDDGIFDNTDRFTVPPGMLFFMSDNRDNALDSRCSVQIGGPGFVPVGNVRGRARVILFSSAGASLADVFSWRPDRYLRAIQ